jgi:3-hydroxyacyl-CoA dehydrogenase/enoyl-CoA hydratase/3-hydroxybutyryl-CoA epimerase
MLGRKAGSGFYKYEGKEQLPNESLNEWRSQQACHPERSEGSHAQSRADIREISRSARDDKGEELARRLIFLMINEAARCLEEKVVAAPEDADYGMILGTGFAPLRGGPLRFADHFGLTNVVAAMDRLAEKDEKFKPCALLRENAESGRKFYEG